MNFCRFCVDFWELWPCFETFWLSMLGRHTKHAVPGARRRRSLLWTHRLPVQRNWRNGLQEYVCHFPSLLTSITFKFKTAVCVCVCWSVCFCFVHDTTGWHLFYSIYFHFIFFHATFGLEQVALSAPAVFTFEALPCFWGMKTTSFYRSIASFIFVLQHRRTEKTLLNVKSCQLPHKKKILFNLKLWFFFPLKKI